MKHSTLPNTDLLVSHIALGTAAFGSQVPRADSFAMLDAYLEAGGTFLDTAHVYADWLGGERHMSEKTLGHWLRASSVRDRVVIATKGGHPDLATPLIPRLAPAQIVADLDESLACLGIDTIDLYWLHRDDPGRPVGEILETLNEQARAGKIRHFGCSNWQPDRIRAAHAHAAAYGLRSFAASQLFWSLAVPNPGAFPSDHALMDAPARAFYAAGEMGVLAFTSQARGFFSKAAAGGLGSLNAALRRDFENERTLARLACARDLARELDTTVTAIVLAYIASQPIVAVPIVGPLTLAQLHDCLGGADLTLPPEMLGRLESAG